MHPWPNRLISPRVASCVPTECKKCVNRSQLLDPLSQDIVTCCKKTEFWFFVNLLKKKLVMYNLSVARVLLDSRELGLAHLTNTGNVVGVFAGNKKLGQQSKQERNLEEEKQVFGPAIQQLSDANNLCQSKIFKLLICVVYVTFLVICRVYSFEKS